MKKIILASLSILTITSCQKVINLNLNSKDPQFVIEGTITNDTASNQIQITKTIDFSEPNVFPAVTNAVVTLSDNVGNSETLSQSAPGIYKINTITGTPGRTYTMNVSVDGKTFTSSSTMPYPTSLDSLKSFEFGFGGQNSINIIPIYKDSLGIENYYRFVMYQNSKQTDNIFVSDDKFNDGLVAQQPLFGQTEIKKYDTIKLDMQCIDKNVYLYFYSLDQNTNGGATPANPVSNITGGALGYFSAYTVSRSTKIIE